MKSLALVSFLIFLSCLCGSSSFADSGRKLKATLQPEEKLDCENDRYWGTQDRCAALKGDVERKITILEFKKKYGAIWSREVRESVEKLGKLVREFSQLEAVATSDSVHGEYSHVENEIWQRWLKDVVRQMETDALSVDESKAVQDSDKKLNAIYAKGFNTSVECKKAQRAWLKVRDKIAEIYQLRFEKRFEQETLKNIAVNRATTRRIEDYQRRIDL